MGFHIREFRAPDDYEAAAELLNLIHSEPTTAAILEEEENKIPPGQLHYNDEGELMGWDRPKWIAEDDQGNIVGYAILWRAPWTVPGTLYQTLVVHPDVRGQGAGSALLDVVRQWAFDVRASRLIGNVRENDEASISFVRKRGFEQERLLFESVLDLQQWERPELHDVVDSVSRSGIQFVTLADEPGEESEQKLYELYKQTIPDIPGERGGFPPFDQWKKWSIELPGARREFFLIAKDGDRYVGVVALLYKELTNSMYHEYTGVMREYRGRRIALALKLLGLQTAREFGVRYLRTHNDSMNAPMLRINRDLLGFRAEPGLYKMVCGLK